MNNYKVIDETSNQCLVSVVMLAYNHAKFISESIESFLSQKTFFPIKLIIAEDFSTDNTREIIINYQKKYPKKIKLILQNKNVGAKKNNIDLFGNLEGKYIAALEGDDYWTDPLKLQKQVDFLEKNEDCNLVYHKVSVYDEDLKVFKEDFLRYPENICKKSLLELVEYGNFMHTPTVMFRNNIIFPTNYNLPVGDYLLWFLNGQKGDYGFLPEIMAVYRMSNSSTWSKKSEYYRMSIWLKVLLKLKEYTNESLIEEALKKQSIRIYRSIIQTEKLSYLQKIKLLKSILLIEPKFIKRLILKK